MQLDDNIIIEYAIAFSFARSSKLTLKDLPYEKIFTFFFHYNFISYYFVLCGCFARFGAGSNSNMGAYVQQ